MASEFDRAHEFEETLRTRAADETVSWRCGVAYRTPSLPDVWDLNLVLVERPDALELDRLLSDVEELQHDSLHRRIFVRQEQAGEELQAPLRKRGWEVTRFLFMACHQPPHRIADLDAVSEVEETRMRPLRETILREQPWGDDEAVRQITASNARFAGAGNGRCFAVVDEAKIVSGAVLFSGGRVAQIEDVATLPEQRGRGHASAVVLKALGEALGTGHELVFLVADEDDWPKELYARLGFDPIGRKYAFLRRPA
jgi:predicted GNAT family acetyltransferase